MTSPLGKELKISKGLPGIIVAIKQTMNVYDDATITVSIFRDIIN